MLNAFCREHGLAVIVDEVFLDYGLDALGDSRCRETAGPSTRLWIGICRSNSLVGMQQWLTFAGNRRC